MSTASLHPELPERLGRYEIGPVIGFGGFAVVVRAYDEGLAVDVAIKVLHRDKALEDEIRERFVREARLLRRVRHPAVVSVHDVGETGDGLPFFVMDLAAGGGLDARLSRRQGVGADVDAADLRAVVTTLAEGLGALHEASVVHRDVKPSNLLVMRSPGAAPSAAPADGRLLAAGERLVIGDLGLAKDQDLSALGPTMVGGTPRFQAPEQTELGGRIDARTDVYSSTAVLWRLLTGQPPPLPDELPVALVGVPGRWRAVLAQGLALHPGDRFASMADWGAAVLEALDDGAVTSALPAVPQLFISYRRADTSGYAARLHDELVDRFGADHVFRDVADIQPGREFEEVIDETLRSCSAVVVVIGQEWLALADGEGRRRLDDPADVLRREVAAALERGTLILPVLVEGAAMPAPDELPPDLRRLAAKQAIELTDGHWDEDLARLVGVVESAMAGVASPTPSGVRAAAPGATCPYKGLAAFQADDAALFFGREELVDHLVSRLQRRAALVVGGPSGSGKSSLVRAGLLPALARGALPGSQAWASCLLTPGLHPLAALHARLGGLDPTVDLPGLDALRADPSLARYAIRRPAVVVVDQLEELFTVCPGRAEREAFLAVLEALTAEDPAVVRVVLAVRADFYAECAAWPWLASVINDNQVLVGPMTRGQLRTAIDGPARRVGLRLEDGLADRILDEGGDDAGALPLVAHALVETWVRRQGALLTVAGYEAAGGVAGAIGRTADRLWDRLDPQQRAAARRLLLRLVNVGDGSGAADTRRLAPWSEVGDDAAARAVVTTFVDARLLTVDERGVELGHEAFIRGWGRLQAWLDESRDDLRARQRVEAAAREWERQGRDPGLLYRGTPLAAALEWREGLAAGDLGAGPAAEFLSAAETVRDDELRSATERRTRSRRVRRRALSALGLLTAVAVLASVVASVALAGSRRDARAAKEQLARNLAALAREQRADDPFLATMLAAEGLARVSPALVEARQALVESRVALAGDRLVPFGDPIPVGDALTVAVDPSGRRAVAGNRDGTLLLWDVAGRRQVATLTGPTGGIEEAAFGPDGKWLVAAADDGAVWKWDVAANQVAGTRLAQLGSIVWSVAVSPDGATIAAATQAGQVWLLDSATGAKRGNAVGTLPRDFDSVAFAPDGASLLAGTGGGEVLVWSLPARELRFPPVAAHTSEVWELVVRPDRPEFLTVSSDGTARRWDLVTGARLPGPYDDAGAPPPAIPAGATLSGGGRSVSLGGGDGRVHTWSLDDARWVDAAGPESGAPVIDASRSADGSTLVSLTGDQTIRVWSAHERAGPVAEAGHVDAPLFGVAVGNGAVAVGTGTGDVLVLDAATGAERERLPGHEGKAFAVAFAGNDRLVTGDDAGALRAWNPTTGRLLDTVPGAHEGAVNAVAVSDDGGRVATAGADGTVRLWDADGLDPAGAALTGLPAPLTDVAFTPDGRSVIAASASGQVARWSIGGKAIGEPFAADDNTAWAVAVSPDGRMLAAAAADEVVSLWSLGGGEPTKVREVGAHEGGALDVAFVDDSTLAATSRSGDVRLWDVATGQALGPALPSATDGAASSPAWHLAVAPDGTVWSVTQAGAVVRVDALVTEVACDLAAASFDDRQRDRLLGGRRPVACR